MATVFKTCEEYSAFLLDFFDGDPNLANTFLRLTQYMFDISESFVVRAKSDLIGISKSDQQYRFYVSKHHNSYIFKTKFEKNNLIFTENTYDEILEKVNLANSLFEEDSELYKRRTRKKSSTGAIVFHKPRVIQKKIPKKEEIYPYNLISSLFYSDSIPEDIPDSFWLQLCDNVEEKVEEIIDTLKEREAFIVRERYREDKTLKEIGSDLGLTRERIRQILKKSLNKLKHISRKGKLLKENISCISLMYTEQEKKGINKEDQTAFSFSVSPNAKPSVLSEKDYNCILDEVFADKEIADIANALNLSQEIIAAMLEKQSVFDDRLSAELFECESYKAIINKIDSSFPSNDDLIRHCARWHEDEEIALHSEWKSDMSISEIANYHNRRKSAIIGRYKKNVLERIKKNLS